LNDQHICNILTRHQDTKHAVTHATNLQATRRSDKKKVNGIVDEEGVVAWRSGGRGDPNEDRGGR
jgi:hypothetical protein